MDFYVISSRLKIWTKLVEILNIILFEFVDGIFLKLPVNWVNYIIIFWKLERVFACIPIANLLDKNCKIVRIKSTDIFFINISLGKYWFFFKIVRIKKLSFLWNSLQKKFSNFPPKLIIHLIKDLIQVLVYHLNSTIFLLQFSANSIILIFLKSCFELFQVQEKCILRRPVLSWWWIILKHCKPLKRSRNFTEDFILARMWPRKFDSKNWNWTTN